ncbi:ATP-binding protein, partial [Lactobacillus equicursoris]|uniref:ATP-binding protein n=1 Tax=Lactobacillus equicursoris TaxID=420645 RepID=UPI00242DFE27
MNQTFIAREAELASLADMYQSPRFEMAVIYGRRRVGKTSLIKEFIKDRPAIYVQGIEATKELNLNYLTNAVLDFE